MSLRFQNYNEWARITGFDVIVTAGVPTESGPPCGALAVDMTNGHLYQNQGTPAVANWVLFSALGGLINVTEIEGLASGEIIIGTNGTPAGNYKVTMSGEGTLSNTGVFILGVMTSNKIIRITSDGAVGASLMLDHLSASPATGDVISNIICSGRDNGAGVTTYAEAYAIIVDPTAAAEYGAYNIRTIDAGVLPATPQFAVVAEGIGVTRISNGATGPITRFFHNSASPLAADNIGGLVFDGRNDVGGIITYGSYGITILDPGAASASAGFGMFLQNGTGVMPTYPVFTVNGSTGSIGVTRESSGTTGAAITFTQISATPAANDEIGLVKFVGGDVALNTQEYAQITGVIVNPVDGSESGAVSFKAANGAGTITQFAWGVHNGTNAVFSVGDGAADGIFSSFGTFNLILRTGNAVTGNITLVDGANGDCQFNLDGTGVLCFGTYAALGAEVPAGYILIKDQVGNSRKVCIVA